MGLTCVQYGFTGCADWDGKCKGKKQLRRNHDWRSKKNTKPPSGSVLV